MARLKMELSQKRREFVYNAFKSIPKPTVAEIQQQLKTLDGFGNIEMGIGPLYKIKKLAETGSPLPAPEIKPTKTSKPKKVKTAVTTIGESETTVLASARKSVALFAKKLFGWN